MIRCSQLVAEGLEAPFDMDLKVGSSAAVITPHEREIETIIKLIIGFQQPTEGKLVVADVQPSALTDTQLQAYRRKVGILYSDGGMLSNLNVWENLTLQLSYEGEYSSVALEAKAREALHQVKYDGPLGGLPARLSLFQRRLVAFARIILADADLVVYQSFFDGMSRSEQKHLRHIAAEYLQQEVRKTALFLTSSPDSLTGTELDFIYTRGGNSQP